jgi:septal ring factor EnvC (AmiA/AmiB activator)
MIDMNRKITLIVLLSICVYSISQNDNSVINDIKPIEVEIQRQQREIESINRKLDKFTGQFKITRDSIKILNAFILNNKNNINVIENDLGIKIQKTGQQSETRISNLGVDLEKTRLYWIIATLTTLLLGSLMYLFLGKRIKSNQTDVETQIKNTKKSLEEESLKLDNKLIEVLETQLNVQLEESKSLPTTTEKVDHSLAIKVADEIVRMQKNISKMDEETKGLKPLVKGIERIQANFASNGYEMVNLLNKDYDERMNIDVINFITDENLTERRKIITSVIKPQVNYNGVLIQRAQVDVSQN